MFTDTQLEIIHYCAQECERQQSGPVSVYNMVNAWDFAVGAQGAIVDLNMIAQIGHYCEPQKNWYKDETYRFFRMKPIFVGNGYDLVEKAPWERVPHLLEMLLESYYEGNLSKTSSEAIYGDKPPYSLAQSDEDIFYYEFENIHPFVDGNGRTGKILYNYLLGSLDNPVMPPNFWGSSNP